MKRRFIVIPILLMVFLASCGKAPESKSEGLSSTRESTSSHESITSNPNESVSSEQNINSDTLQDLYNNTEKALKTTMKTSFGNIEIDAFVNIPKAETAPVLTKKLSIENISIDSITEVLLGKKSSQMTNISEKEGAYVFEEGKLFLNADLDPKTYVQSVSFSSDLDLSANYNGDMLENIYFTDDLEKLNESLKKYDISFEELNKIVSDYKQKYIDTLKLGSDYQIKDIEVRAQSEDGNSSYPQYGFNVSLEAVKNDIPIFKGVVYIGDTNIPLVGDSLTIRLTKDGAYNFDLSNIGEIIKTDDSASKYVALDEAIKLAEKSNHINDPSKKSVDGKDYTITQIRFLYMPTPPDDAGNKTYTLNDQVRYNEVKLTPCWYFRSEVQSSDFSDFYSFMVNAITGEVYSCKR